MLHEWLLFLPQIPSAPSSLRVLVWRRLRAGGATALQNGVWVFPRRIEHERFVRELLAEIEPQGGTGFILSASTLDAALDARIVEQFRVDRDQEYTEFAERCEAFLQEIDKETKAHKFIFAELEENEQDLNKLTGWLQKIQARDYFKGHQSETAESTLAECRRVFEIFAQTTYTQAGLDHDDRPNAKDNG